MKDRIAKQAYDKGYDAGVADKAGGYARPHTECNPYKKTHSLRTYTRYDYWLMGYDDGYTGHVRRMSQEEADQLKADRMAKLEEIVQKVAAIETRNDESWSTYACPVCKHQGAEDEHYDGCPVPPARALAAKTREVVTQ